MEGWSPVLSEPGHPAAVRPGSEMSSAKASGHGHAFQALWTEAEGKTKHLIRGQTVLCRYFVVVVVVRAVLFS